MTIQRITGMASGLDVDTLVKTTMKAYTAKVDAQKQKKEVLEIKQKLYRDIINDGRNLFNKYFDIAKSDSLLYSKNYVTTKFSSTDSTIATATALTGAVKDNYTVNVESVAKASSTVLTSAQLSSDMEFKNAAGKSVFIKASDLSGKTDKEKATLINTAISSIGLTASTSDFAPGITVKTTDTGSSQKFSISSGSVVDTYFTGTSGTVSDIGGATFTVDALTGASAKDIEFTLGSGKVWVKASDLKAATSTFDTKLTTLNTELGALTVGSDEYTAKQAEITQTESERSVALASTIDSKLGAVGISASKSETSNDIVLKPDVDTNTFNYTFGDITDQHLDTGATTIDYQNGTDLKGTIKNSSGTIYFGYAAADIPAGGISMAATSNKITLDGVQFNINDVGTTKLSGTVDATAAKDKIVKFVNDYNSLIEKINKLVTDKHDRSYNPLTDDQKKEMSDDEVKLWNEKVQKGQLSRDTDLSRITNNLKNAMSSTVMGATTILEKIGITPVKDYTTKSGMFTIDEDKLTAALETNPDAVMNVFTQYPANADSLSDTDKFNQSGILYRMKDILNDEFMSSTKSALINKAGLEGTISFTQSTLSKSITDYEKKISVMNESLSDKEQALYTKYSKLETAMNKYSSQSTYLSSMMGSNG